MSYGLYFFISLLITLVIEMLVLLVTGKYLLEIKIKTEELLYWGVFTNLFTLPYLWFVFPLFVPPHYYVLIGEILVVLVEAVIYLKAFKINLNNALALSLLANIASYLVGIMVLR